MLEFLISVIPLILICTAVGLIIINFDEVFSYLGYLLQQLISTPDKTTAASESSKPIDPRTSESFNLGTIPFIALKRITTLITNLFFPNLNIHIPHKRYHAVEQNYFEDSIQASSSAVKIKSYSSLNQTVLSASQPISIEPINPQQSNQNKPLQPIASPSTPNTITAPSVPTTADFGKLDYKNIQLDIQTPPPSTSRQSAPLNNLHSKTQPANDQVNVALTTQHHNQKSPLETFTNLFIYSLVIAPFALIIFISLLYISDYQKTGIHPNNWITNQISKYINNQ